MRPNALLPIFGRARWLVVAFVLGLCVWLLPGLGTLEHDDDVLAFLPPEHPDVVAFQTVARRYGMLELALVGLRDEGADLLEPARVEQIRGLARALGRIRGVALTLSFPDLPDPQVRDETLVVEALVPPELDERDAIAKRVLGNPNAVGNLVSRDGTAAAVLVYLAPASAAEQRETLEAVARAVEHSWPGEAYFAGSPFIETHAAVASRADIERLSPVVIAILGVASALLLGSVTGALLNLSLTGLGVGLVLGGLGRFGIPLTIVSGTLPVMMVAFGGAFGMHIIAGYQRHEGTAPERAMAALRELWGPVVLSGVTTAAAFFALVAMPQAPMRDFGVVAGVSVLVLLALALTVLPVALASLPARWLRHRPARRSPVRFFPPLWLLASLAVLGLASSVRLEADPDTASVFADDSPPAEASRFFDRHFGGASFVQIEIEADLTEPVVLRLVRDLAEQLRAVPGVSEVRTLVEPVALLTEGFGGRHGIPANREQARRVVTSLADQAAMAQLMTAGSDSTLIHVKLAPQSTKDQQATLDAVIAHTDAHVPGRLRVAATTVPAVQQAVREAVARRLAAVLGGAPDPQALARGWRSIDRDALRVEATRLRARILGTDEVVEPVPPEVYERLPIDALIDADGATVVEALIRDHVPELAAQDPEGVPYAAEQLALRLRDARRRLRVQGMCAKLGVDVAEPRAEASPQRDDALLEDETSRPSLSKTCTSVARIVAELDDETWLAPSPEVPALRELPVTTRVTGQPIVGRAFAASVTRSLWHSTTISWLVLAVVLAIARHLRALVPATWTLAVTLGVLAWLGHPVSVGTSMITCIALGAGVDFAIHLSVAARRVGGSDGGRQAARRLGAVVSMTGIQLAAAFSVLVVSQMPPLQDFGLGLALGLTIAAVGAVWWAPRLFRYR